jgi:pilus assembly protein Flp/PilA
MSKVSSMFRRFVKEESGATMVEYGIMVAVIAAVSIVIVRSIGNKTNNAFSAVDSGLTPP